MSAVIGVDRDRATGARSFALLACAALVVGVAYYETFESMVQTWERSATFAHAFLVAPIVLWLIWRQRRQPSLQAPQAAPVWLLPMGACALAWLLGDLAKVNAVAQFAAVGMLVLSVPLVLGTAAARVIAFPLAFLFFMVPFGEFLLPTMMLWTADVTVAALRLLGVPVYRDGLQFVIPTGTWSVVEACSGARYLIASFMVGSLFAYLNFRSNRRRALFCAVSLVVPIVANWMRAIMIVLLGHLTNNRIAAGVDHLVYGWVFFGIVVSLMFWIGSRWSDAEGEGQSASSPAVGTLVARWPGRSRVTSTLAAFALVVILAVPRAIAWQPTETADAPPALVLPALSGYDAGGPSTRYEPVFLEPTAQASRAYAAEGRVFEVHVALYRHQDYSRKLVSSANALVKPGDNDWHRVRGGWRRIDGPSGPVEIRDAELRFGRPGASDARRIAVRQILWVDDHFVARDIEAVGRGVLSRLAGRGDDAAAVTFYVDATDSSSADRALDAFVSRHLGEFGAWLSSQKLQR